MDKQNVIVFGTGRYFHSKEKSINRDYNVISYIDNKVMVGDSIIEDGKVIMSPENIDTLPKCKILLMSAKYYEMYEQLTNLGIEKERLIFGFLISPAYDKAEHLLEKYEAKISYDKKALRLVIGDSLYDIDDELKFQKVIRDIYHKEFREIELLSTLPIDPLSRRFGKEYGKAIDRYYIEHFLEQNSQYIFGDVLEVADSTYTRKFASGRYTPYVLHVNGWGEGNVIKGNLETGEGISENSMDCFICTQTIQCVFDLNSAMANIHRLLRRGGVALITAAGIAQISNYDYLNWGEYWRFTKQSLERLCKNCFGDSNVIVRTYGNMKVSIAMLYGLCQEDLKPQDYAYNDDQYPFIVSAICKK